MFQSEVQPGSFTCSLLDSADFLADNDKDVEFPQLAPFNGYRTD